MNEPLLLPAVSSGSPLLDIVHCCDALTFLRALPDNVVNCIVTSPPYFGLRDYGVMGQIGIEPTPKEFVATMVTMFRECRRVLRDDGTCWLNLGDSYASGEIGRHDQKAGFYISGHGAVKGYGKPRQRAAINAGVPSKNLLGIPWRVAFALQDDGWYLRSDIIWHKPNPMPESVTDRPTKAHEYVFLLTKNADYWYDQDAVREPFIEDGGVVVGRGVRQSVAIRDGRNPEHKDRAANGGYPHTHEGRNLRTVWTIPTQPTSFAHFATYPQALVERCILAGCPQRGLVLDPFMGSGTTALVARRLRRHYLGCDLNPEYVALARRRLANSDPFAAREVADGVTQLSLWGEAAR